MYLSGERGYTAKIQEAINRTKQEFIYIGLLLSEVEAYGYYNEAGFSDVYEYCEVTFGFKRSSTNNFIRVYRQFGEAMGLKEAYRDYSYSQLTEMCSMNPLQLAKCRPEYSVQKLRDLKRVDALLDRPTPVQTSGRSSVSEADRVKTSVFDNQGDVGVFICVDHYSALEAYLLNRFKGTCNFEKAVDFMDFVKHTGADFQLHVVSGVHRRIYTVSLMFDMDGAHIRLDGRNARISPAGCFYVLRKLCGRAKVDYITR